MNEQLLIVVVGGCVTALVTGSFTAWLTAVWTTKKNEIHMQYFERSLLEVKKEQASQALRLNKAEIKLAILTNMPTVREHIG